MVRNRGIHPHSWPDFLGESLAYKKLAVYISLSRYGYGSIPMKIPFLVG
jgi:hypothetical protein